VHGVLLVASAREAMRLAIPPWACIFLVGMGAAYLVLGARWFRLFEVLSMTFLGCIVGLFASPWPPLAPPLVVAVGGMVVGGLSAVFRRVARAVLSSVVLAAVASELAALVVGEEGFTTCLAVNLSVPSVAHDAVLAAAVTGLLAGATLAIGHPRLSRRLVPSAQGAALVLLGVAELLAAWRAPARPGLATAYPLTLTAAWVCLVAIGLRIQRAVEPALEPEEENEDAESDEGN